MNSQPDIKPNVLLIDDHADVEGATTRNWSGAMTLTVRHPNDVEKSELGRADLVLVDFQLDNWPERDKVPSIACRPLDGLALAAVLRVQANLLNHPTPTAFALRSAHLDKLSRNNPPELRSHVLASRHDLEWVFPKNAADGDQSGVQVAALADAVRSLPDSWHKHDVDTTRRLIEQWLGLREDHEWHDQAWRDIAACHPPIHELEHRSHGLYFFRWFLHRILPYPCFIYNDRQLAARLRVSVNSLTAALHAGLEGHFQAAEYTGQLTNFLGRRWWRSGCESIIWNTSEGSPFDPERLIQKLQSFCNGKLQHCGLAQPVVGLDANFLELDQFLDIDNAVRLQPDDWPAHADQAWAEIQLASNSPRLCASVVENDRDRLRNATEDAF